MITCAYVRLPLAMIVEVLLGLSGIILVGTWRDMIIT